MRKAIAMILALMLVLALFAGCNGGGGNNTPTAAPATQAPATQAPATEAPAEDEGPYHLAAGKYAVNEKGVPLSKYDYELPLTTSDETFSYWAGAMLPDQIDPDHYEEMPYPAYLLQKTGVHIEYLMITGASRMENFSALLASDALPDLMINYKWYYPRTIQNSIEDGYTVNIYDYKEYCPNYYYCIWEHEDDIAYRPKLMMDDHTISEFNCLNDEHQTTYGACTRGDWLDRLGLKPDDIVTLEDFHDLCTAYQTQFGVEHPMALYNTLDVHMYMSCFDTICAYSGTAAAPLAPLFVKDGKVQLATSTEGDKNYMSTMSKWYGEGIIIPNWITFAGNVYNVADFMEEKIGITSMLPSESSGYVNLERTPEAYWIGLHEPVLYKGQVFHLGDPASWLQGMGSWTIGAHCENIPLLVTYADWFYSEEGYIDSNWGPEGYCWEYNEKGERQLTDFILENPGGASWAIVQFALCDIFEAGILCRRRSYAYPGGEVLLAWYDIWGNPDFYRYDGTMVWPDCMTYDAEDTSYLNSVGTDINTFISENYLQFVDGSKPMSDWDSYIDTLTSLTGWKESIEIYQSYYDDFMASRG